MKISKKYLTAFSGLIFILLTGIGLACAFEDLDYSHSHFFNPEMSKSEFHFFYRDTYFPFYSKTDETYAAPANDFTEINKKEWTDFFNNKISNEDMGTLLYKTNTLEIDSLIFRLKNNQYPLSGKLAKYSILKYDDKKTAISFLFYLGYAKRCEVYAAFIPGERWDDKTSDFVENPDPRKDISSINKLIEGGKDLLKNVKYQFVSDRYNFQIIRLYYHSNQFQPCLDFYQGIISKITQQSIKYRMMGYAAAAYYKLKNYSNANYLYSRIFSEYAPMRKTVFSSFAPKEETDFLQSLSLAESNKDKCALWAMVGIKNDPLRAMKEIYKLEPKSPYLSLLLTRAVNIEEEKFLVVPEGIPDDNQYFVINNYIMNYNKENYNFKSSSVNNDLVQFIKDVAAKNEINDPYLWQLSEAYLLSALGKYDEAVPFYAKAKLLCKGDIYLQTQVSKFELISDVAKTGKVDENFENGFVKKLMSLKEQVGKLNKTDSASIGYDNAFDWMRKILAHKYSAQGNLIKADCIAPFNTYNIYSNAPLKKQLLDYMDKKNKTEFDKFLLNLYFLKKADIYERDAIELFMHGNADAALAKLDECPGTGNTKLTADPFIIHIIDNHDADQEMKNKTSYTKYDFIKKMAALIKEAGTNPKNKSEIYFNIANGFYNATYFGNIRRFYDTQVTEFNDSVFPVDNEAVEDYAVNAGFSNYKTLNLPILDNSQAEKYYNLAFSASSDPEFKAKCLFMASKCEQNNFFVNKPKNYNGDFKAGKYFHQLKDIFSNTKYYQEIIKECGYFKSFVQKGK